MRRKLIINVEKCDKRPHARDSTEWRRNCEITKYGFVAGRGHGNRSTSEGESLFVIFGGIYHPKRAQDARYGTFGQKRNILDRAKSFVIIHLCEEMV